MLYFQKAIVEGSMGLLFQCFMWDDLAKSLDGEAKKEAQMMLDLMTTVAKTYPAEMGTLAVNQGLQVLGGYGYTEDFPLEQMARDVRIMSIYEGTTGIHGLTLLGRGIPANNGEALQTLGKLVFADIAVAKGHESLIRLRNERRNRSFLSGFYFIYGIIRSDYSRLAMVKARSCGRCRLSERWFKCRGRSFL
jgi:butyryl-CoA dehydrogenase